MVTTLHHASSHATGAKDGAAQAEYRKLPAVDALLQEPAILLLASQYGQAQITDRLRDLLTQTRQAIAAGQRAPERTQWAELLATELAATTQPSLRAVINATGVLIHTNLGRAPLSRAACEAVAQIAGGYNNLEYNLIAGERGSRYDHARALLCELTGAEDATGSGFFSVPFAGAASSSDSPAK